MNFERKIIETIKVNGENDGIATILYAPEDMFMRKAGRKWDLLYVGIYNTMKTDKETVQFFMVETDNQNKDTTNQRFFEWDELNEELRIKVRAWINRINEGEETYEKKE